MAPKLAGRLLLGLHLVRAPKTGRRYLAAPAKPRGREANIGLSPLTSVGSGPDRHLAGGGRYAPL